MRILNSIKMHVDFLQQTKSYGRLQRVVQDAEFSVILAAS